MAVSHYVSTARCQASQSSPREFEHKQKIKPAQVQVGAPAHLARALYLPIHTHNTSHLPIYDISDHYFETLGPFPLGERKYKIEFCLLLKPCGDHPEDDVRYLVDMDSSGLPATIRERCIGRDALEVAMQVQSIECETRPADRPRSSSQRTQGLVYAAPVEPTTDGSTRCPSLELDLGASKSKDATPPRSFKWQLYMDNPGSLRYDLIKQKQNSLDGGYNSIVAIYHHCGFEKDLCTNFSEGVILLPGMEDPVLDITIISSLLFLLHSVRKQGTGVKKSRAKSILRRFAA
ncbi:uncharacterized protein NECHADRAFT_45614 [Fusarium vanettenii 77-13-4]|uniref:Uncharacterized protein n=1 Tax=Fusarium vanettenii (strain ATCC MYA-4622 / CBS 123669 / FGSC 9596 / NRRL 45880 / 77-13-4) TaxID=660122 RepID=C7ZBD3_FUSV7|nr:uncharacterized protein NECHADRAFT_45614 [Fusarium vanettenii 77-13-4]EEU38699.1 hypothetical protein NECHADRAFT_45614 [Fusarium vanettenii 77-13-4]